MLLWGDMSPNTLDTFTVLIDGIYGALLNNPLNQNVWPKFCSKDVGEKFHEILDSVAVVKGYLSNKTFLPLPMNGKEFTETVEQIVLGFVNLSIYYVYSDRYILFSIFLIFFLSTIPCDMKLQNLLEGIVIKWSYLINETVTDTSAKLFYNGAQPLPSDEYTYWNNRLTNLENLYTQLIENNRKMVGVILEKIHSVYFTAFRQSFESAVTALTQARDVSVYLNAFAKHTHHFQSHNFLECNTLIKPMLHCMCVMWSKSIYYPKGNWAHLIRMIANMLIEESMNALDAETLFQNDIDDTISKIINIVAILNTYK